MKSLVLFCLVFISGVTNAQKSNSGKYSINANAGLTIPVYGNYLRENWNIGPYFSFKMIRELSEISVLFGIDYEYLRKAEDKFKVVTPIAGVQQVINIKQFEILSGICVGYSWVNFTVGKGVVTIPPVQYSKYRLDGLSTSLDIKLAYTISDLIKISFGVEHLNIFQPIDLEGINPDESKMIGLTRPNISVLFRF